LTAAIKGGKSADEFLIRGAVASKKASKPKRARKAPQVTLVSLPADGLRFLNENVRRQKGRAAVGDPPPDDKTVMDREVWHVGALGRN
jgi:hypothetical protein